METPETPMREKITQDLKTAMKAGDRATVDALRLINAALKDKDIEARGAGKTLSEDDILALLQKMIKSRQESLDIYEKAGRQDLADKEKSEIAVISAYLPQQLSEAEVAEAVKAAIAEAGAASIKDMGKVVAALKAKYTGRIDFAKASAAVKAALNG
ncbi:aspartyl-tRNA amidotransferase subunit B [Methylocystis echinoides]|uniref:Aspartyl-tRNA amidotransferase subunit B n=2 Tax=Methylocystis echinoides TaxID=29468 RepID=A0A9W6GWK4_9HYPH|nr:aspartyl-tRNA amidotransferase subunit B [Methylocystis echinoides]